MCRAFIKNGGWLVVDSGKRFVFYTERTIAWVFSVVKVGLSTGFYKIIPPFFQNKSHGFLSFNSGLCPISTTLTTPTTNY